MLDLDCRWAAGERCSFSRGGEARRRDEKLPAAIEIIAVQWRDKSDKQICDRGQSVGLFVLGKIYGYVRKINITIQKI